MLAMPDKGKIALLALSRQYNGANNGRLRIDADGSGTLGIG
jgi:hypothetical protein